MKSKIIYLVCTMLLIAACEKEENTWKESLVTITVYDESGKTIAGIPVKMYDEKDHKAFEQDNLTPPTTSAITNAKGAAQFILPGETWFAKQSQRFLTFVVQEGGGESNYRIWSTGKTIEAGKTVKLEIRLVSSLTSKDEEAEDKQPEDKGTLTGLSISRLPHKTLYTLGEELNLNGLQLIGLYSNGEEHPVAVTPEHVSGFSSDIPADRQEVTVSIEEQHVSFTISIAPVRVQEGVLTEVYDGYSEITLPAHVTAIAPQVFLSNKQITKVIMNEGLVSIGQMAFFNSSIQEVVFPSTLKHLEPNIFYRCEQLKRIDLSHTQITRLPEESFVHAGIEEISLPSTLKTIDIQAFLMTQKLKSVIIPQNVRHIGSAAFRGSGITSVQLPNSISTIASYAFAYCPNLTEVTTYGPVSDNDPDAIIKEYCFVDCPELTRFEIPQSICTLGQCLITGNQKVHKLTIPFRVTRINISAFDNTMVEEIIVEAPVPPITPEDEWYGFPENARSISVPAQSVETYKKAKGWDKFAAKIIPFNSRSNGPKK